MTACNTSSAVQRQVSHFTRFPSSSLLLFVFILFEVSQPLRSLPCAGGLLLAWIYCFHTRYHPRNCPVRYCYCYHCHDHCHDHYCNCDPWCRCGLGPQCRHPPRNPRHQNIPAPKFIATVRKGGVKHSQLREPYKQKYAAHRLLQENVYICIRYLMHSFHCEAPLVHLTCSSPCARSVPTAMSADEPSGLNSR